MSYIFGSFNLKVFSKTAQDINDKKIQKKDADEQNEGRRDYDLMARIIKDNHLDVVAFQEVFSEGQTLKTFVDTYLKGWKLRWGEPKESSNTCRINDKRGEGFAFAWNAKRLQLAESSTPKGKRFYEPRSVSEAVRIPGNDFARIPYYARFVPKGGGPFVEFRLINVHLFFGKNNSVNINKRKAEYKYLVEEVYPKISMERRYGNNRPAYTIVLGDYNLGISKLNGVVVSTKEQDIITVQDKPTTVSKSEGYANDYDHFTFDASVLKKDDLQYTDQRIDAVEDYCNGDFETYFTRVSDHVPVLLKIEWPLFARFHDYAGGNRK